MKDTAYSFAQKVDQQLEATSLSAYHLRSGRVKLLREEIYPISRLALQLKQPGLKVEVEAYEDNGAADGRIWISGFKEDNFDVQVTYVHNHDKALRSEMLVSKGYAPGAGKIKKDKKTNKIDASCEAVDHDEHFERIAGSIIERFKKKVSMGYSSKTSLIIAFEEVKFYGIMNWNRLMNLIKQKENLEDSNFLSIYLFNNATNELQRVA